MQTVHTHVERPIFIRPLMASQAARQTVSVTVPNVVATQQADATRILSFASLGNSVSFATSATVPSGTVISQNPVAGSSVAFGSTVGLVVSTGNAYQAVMLEAFEPALGTVTLAWSSAGSPGYHLYINGIPQSNVIVGQTTTLTGIVLGSHYTFAIVPVDANGNDNGSLSNVIYYGHSLTEVPTVEPLPWINSGNIPEG